MVDVSVASDGDANLEQTGPGLFGPFWISETEALIVYHNSSDDLAFARTTNGGTSWSTGDLGATNLEQCSAFFDQEVPGDTGTLVHVVWANSVGGDSVLYANIDVSDGSTSTPVEISTSVSYSGSSVDNRIAIGKTVSGNLIVAYVTGTEDEAWKSSNGGSSWSSIASPFDDSSSADFIMLYPADTADGNDCAAILHDVSGNQLFCRIYDDSADSWSSTSISTGVTGDSTYRHWDAAVRHSDGAILLAAHNDADTSTDDIKTFEILPDSTSSPTITAKTDVVSNVSEAGFCGVLINQQDDTVYVAFTRGSSFRATTGIYYYSSSDDMSSWSSETKYSEDSDDDIRGVSAGRSVGSSGGYFMPCWNNDDLTEVFSGTSNSVLIEEAASGVTGTVSSSLDGVSTSASGSQEDSGIASSSLLGVSSSGSGSQENTASGASALSGVSVSGTGSQALNVSGVATITLSGVSSSANGSQELTGTASSALSGISAQGSSAQEITGSASSELSGISSAGAGEQSVSASGVSALSGFSTSANASQELSGATSSSLSGVSAQGSGSALAGADGLSALSGVSVSGTSSQENSGAGTSSLSGASFAGSASQEVQASGASSLSGVSSSASGSTTEDISGAVSSSLSGVSASSSGSQELSASASSELSGVSSSGAGSQENSASASSELSGVSAQGSGSLDNSISGSASVSLSGVSVSVQAAQELTGEIASILRSISAVGAGLVPQNITGSASLQLSGISIAGISNVQSAGSSSKLLSGNYEFRRLRQAGPGGWIHKL